MMIKKFSRIMIAIIITILSLTSFTGCNQGGETRAMMVDWDKFWYARFMRFDFRVMIDGEPHNSYIRALERINPGGWNEHYDPYFNELVFVHNKEQAQDFPDNVIVAWPQEGGFTEGLLAGLNLHASASGEDLLFFGRRGPNLESDKFEGFRTRCPNHYRKSC